MCVICGGQEFHSDSVPIVRGSNRVALYQQCFMFDFVSRYHTPFLWIPVILVFTRWYGSQVRSIRDDDVTCLVSNLVYFLVLKDTLTIFESAPAPVLNSIN